MARFVGTKVEFGADTDEFALRRDLAVRYLDDRKLHVSKIAWLLGFHEVSAFTHACKRWTGKTGPPPSGI
jgi:AraC-like DNA-binding protein